MVMMLSWWFVVSPVFFVTAVESRERGSNKKVRDYSSIDEWRDGTLSRAENGRYGASISRVCQRTSALGKQYCWGMEGSASEAWSMLVLIVNANGIIIRAQKEWGGWSERMPSASDSLVKNYSAIQGETFFMCCRTS